MKFYLDTRSKNNKWRVIAKRESSFYPDYDKQKLEFSVTNIFLVDLLAEELEDQGFEVQVEEIKR